MAEQPEIPEADDPFGKRVAVTIAILAVFMALIANRGDDAKTEALLKTTEAANRWSYYQAKSIKEHSYDIQSQVLAILPRSGGTEAYDKVVGGFAKQIQRYDGEKRAIEAEARALEGESREALAINNRCDQGVLFLQMAIVVCSVAILAKFALLWWGGMAIGIVGAVIGVTSLWVSAGKPPENQPPPHETVSRREASPPDATWRRA